MRAPRHADVLKDYGFQGSVEEFRAALAEIKAEHFADITDEELTYGKESSARFCVLVRSCLGGPRLGRVFLLRSLVGLRKHGKREMRVS
jgi:hypothetical protein